MHKRKIASIFWLLLIIPLSVGVLAYRWTTFPSGASSARTPVINPLTKKPIPAGSTFDAATLQKYLTVETALLGADDHVSVYMKDENTDEDVNINAIRSWIPASTIKAFVAVEAFRQRDAGIISFDTPVTIVAQNVVPTELETDEFPRLREGTQATIRQLVEAMIIQSDNTAYNTLLDILDRRNINNTLRTFGITQTVVGEKLNLDDGQFQTDLLVPGRQPNTITAKDLATLFDLLYNNKIPHSNEILAIFKQQKINTMIPALLPQDTVIAHKTGDWAPIYHDAGIVYKPNDPFILSVLTDANNPTDIAQLARVAYYRTSQVVGEEPTSSPKLQAEDDTNTDKIYLAEAPQATNVLGAQTTTDTGERIYTVEPGDTVWSIALSQYGSGYEYPAIISRNNLTNPSAISPGTTLYLPPIPGTSFVPQEQNVALNALDLGVTADDLKVGKTQTQTLGAAFVLPGSPLYVVKEWVLNQAVQHAPTSDAEIDALLAVSQSKLAEVKSELLFGNVGVLQSLLTQSEQALQQAVAIAKTSTNNDVALYKIKQQRDLHFAVLADSLPSLGQAEKDAYINAVYSFYTKQKQDIAPAVASISPTNPLQQKPVIGTVTSIQNDIASVKGDDGKVMQVVLTTLTPTRGYGSSTSAPATSIQVGEKLAVVGSVTPESIVTPQFILRDIPKTLPVGHRGTVVAIDPSSHTMTIRDTQGRIDTIVVNESTTITSKDTDVTIAGIKAGSVVTVVGDVVTPKPTGSASGTSAPTGSVSPSIYPSQGVQRIESPTAGVPPTSQGSNSQQSGTVLLVPSAVSTRAPSGLRGAQPPSENAGQTVQAITVTVDKNASGKNERISSSKPSGGNKPANPAKSPSKSQPAAPPPKPPEIKSNEEKK